MSIRDKPIYISHDIGRALWLIAKADKGRKQFSPEGLPLSTVYPTADEIADRILREVIQNTYPQLLEHQAQIEKMEKALIATLQKKE